MEAPPDFQKKKINKNNLKISANQKWNFHHNILKHTKFGFVMITTCKKLSNQIQGGLIFIVLYNLHKGCLKNIKLWICKC